MKSVALSNRHSRLAAVAMGLVSFGCIPDVPTQVAGTTIAERLTQRFLVQDRSDADKKRTYLSLVGPEATRALETIESDTVFEASGGTLEVRGSGILTARVSAFDATLYLIEGIGQFDVYNKAHGPERLLVSATFEIGNQDTHAISDLRSLQIVLPIRHSARLNPTLLLAQVALQKETRRCIIPVVGARDPVLCTAAGVGSPYRAAYYVRLHLKEIVPATVYAIDRGREHEVFNEGPTGVEVFGCLKLEDSPDSSKMLDLRALKYLTPLPRRGPTLAPIAGYDRWRIAEKCDNGLKDAATVH